MSEVARLAGVSIGTVSNALNRPEVVRSETLEKIRRAIDQLGYVPNSAARVLAAGRSTTVGMVLVDMGNSLFVNLARGAERTMEAAGYNLLLSNADIDLARQDAYLELFDREQVAGIILAPLDSSLASMQRVRRQGTNVVLVNYESPETDACSVVVDERLGGYLATKHLLDIGRRRIAFVGTLRFKAHRERLEGAQQAMAEAASGASFEVLAADALRVPAGRVVGRSLAERPSHTRPDGVFAASDPVAEGCIQQLHYSGLRIPEDIAVVGFDDDHFASDGPIAFSTVAQPAGEMGHRAAELLIEEIEQPADHEHRAIVLEPRLITRRSTTGVDTDWGDDAPTALHR